MNDFKIGDLVLIKVNPAWVPNAIRDCYSEEPIEDEIGLVIETPRVRLANTYKIQFIGETEEFEARWIPTSQLKEIQSEGR
jgi:hypothetical protein